MLCAVASPCLNPCCGAYLKRTPQTKYQIFTHPESSRTYFLFTDRGQLNWKVYMSEAAPDHQCSRPPDPPSAAPVASQHLTDSETHPTPKRPAHQQHKTQTPSSQSITPEAPKPQLHGVAQTTPELKRHSCCHLATGPAESPPEVSASNLLSSKTTTRTVHSNLFTRLKTVSCQVQTALLRRFAEWHHLTTVSFPVFSPFIRSRIAN